MWFPNRSDTNRPVQAQNTARSLKFRIYVGEELYYPSSENKGADQLRSNCEAELRLCFRLCRLLFSHVVAHIYILFSYIKRLYDKSIIMVLRLITKNGLHCTLNTYGMQSYHLYSGNICNYDNS